LILFWRCRLQYDGGVPAQFSYSGAAPGGPQQEVTMTDQDEYVEKVIEANEERAKEQSQGDESKVEKEVDGLFAPLINVINSGDGDTVEEHERDRRQNDAEQGAD
jgi:hypothetical protein